MIFTANDLSNWVNFPKGLKVLLLHDGGDVFSAVETRSKLESLDYIVTTFTNESEALSAVFKNPKSFHIAIIDVIPSDEDKSFKFLKATKYILPNIMISSEHCIATTMKCIALGAVEFLQKPLSLEKLKNIWQHVVHKAFRESSVLESLKPAKESVNSMLRLDTDMTVDAAPSTPQLKQVPRLLDKDNINSSTEKENVEDESKSVETSNHELVDENVVFKEEKRDIEIEEVETEYLKTKKTCTIPINKSAWIKNLSGNKTTRKKVDWTQELHKKFVEAVEQLGIDQAIPSRILELMKVDGLTRHNVASHLQKFRMQRRNILPKEEHNVRWLQSRDNHRQIQRYYNGFQHQHRPVMAYPVWGVHPPLWPPPLQSSSPLPPWHPYPTITGNAWGCPAGLPTTGTFNPPPANQPDEETIDKVVKEAISKPWLPLPLGLKPPSTETVLTELSRQGISVVVPSSS